MLLVLCIAAAVALVWLLLVASAVSSLRRKNRAPRARLVMAVVPVLAGAVALSAHLRFTFNDYHFNVSLLFLLPIILGLFAAVSCLRAKQTPVPAPPPVNPPQPQVDTEEP